MNILSCVVQQKSTELLDRLLNFPFLSFSVTVPVRLLWALHLYDLPSLSITQVLEVITSIL